MLKRTQNLLSILAKKNLYYGHIYSHLSYCISTWGPMIKDTEIKCLQKLQNKCIHLIDKSRNSLEKKYKDLQILRVNEIVDLELCKIDYRLLANDLPTKVLSCISTNAYSKSLNKKHGYCTHQKKSTEFA